MGLMQIALINSKCLMHSRKFSRHLFYEFVRYFHESPVNRFPRAAPIYKNNSFRSNAKQLETEFPDVNEEPILESSDDVFGIESDEGCICFDDTGPPNLENLKSLMGDHKRHEEVVCVTTFGQIRRDSDNPPTVRGTFKSQAYSSYLKSQKKSEENQTTLADTKIKGKRSKLNHLTTKKEAYDLYSKSADQQDSFINKSNSYPMNANISTNVIHDTNNVEQLQLDNVTHSTNYPSDHFKVPYSDNLKSKFNKHLEKIVTENTTDDSINEPISKDLSQIDPKEQLNYNSNYIDECYFDDHYNDNPHYYPSYLPDSEMPIINNNNQENIQESFLNNSAEAPHDSHLNSSIIHKSSGIIKEELTDNSSYVDEQYFGDLHHDTNRNLENVEYSQSTIELVMKEDESLKQMEETPIQEFNNVSPNDRIDNGMLTNKNYNAETTNSSSYFDDQYKEKSDANLNEFKYGTYSENQPQVKIAIEKNDHELNRTSKENVVHNKSHFKNKVVPTSIKEASNEFKHIKKTKVSVEKNLTKEDEDKNKKDGENAMDYVMNLKKATQIRSSLKQDGDFTEVTGEILDSKGFRILKNQVPDLSKLTREELVIILKNRVLFQNEDVVVLNKPYNMVTHDAKTNKGPSLSLLLDGLARILDPKIPNPTLITVHRLDKETTGCMLLARNEKTAQYLKSLFAQRKIEKTYWVVTSHVPDPLEGIIDIPITEGLIDKKTRMVLNPVIPKDVNYKSHSKRGKRAVTHYKVLMASGNAALVEVQPETGLKHQIRVHFGFGLNCPIIGDHKYSHLTKLVPQKLPSDILEKLSVRQSKVRHIPMHIHAKSIVIPEMLDGRTLYAYAPLPYHMAKNLQRLKIKKK